MFLKSYFFLHAICILFSGIAYSVKCEDRIWTSRNPRYLPFPKGLGNKLQIITGFGIPVDLKDNTVDFGLIMKTNYELPTNSVQFSHPELAFEDVDLKMTRWSLYSVLESALKKLSLGGRDCILRSICQAAFTSFDSGGLLGEILEILFLPSRTNELSIRNNHYTAAEQLSQQFTEERHCAKTFPNCPSSLLDIITTVEDSGYGEGVLDKITELL